MTKILIEEATVNLALEALLINCGGNTEGKGKEAITALREAQAEQPQQEPVAWMVWGDNNVPSLTFTKPADKYVFDALYTSPLTQRTWVGLTDEEITDIWAESSPYYHEDDFARAIEAKLKEKNQ